MNSKILGLVAVGCGLMAGPMTASAVVYSYSYTFSGGKIVNGTVDGTFNAGANAGSAADDYLSSVTVLSANFDGTPFASSSLTFLSYPTYAAGANMYFDGPSNNFIISACDSGAGCPPVTPIPWQYLVVRPNTGNNGESAPQYSNSADGISLDDRGFFGAWTLVAVGGPSPVPEPGTLALLGLGLAGLGLSRRRKA